MPELKLKDLSQIVLEMLASLNAVDHEKNRLIEITVDGEISKDEMQDFIAIKNQLDKISLSVNTLQLWIDKTIADGKIDPKLLEYFNK